MQAVGVQFVGLKVRGGHKSDTVGEQCIQQPVQDHGVGDIRHMEFIKADELVALGDARTGLYSHGDSVTVADCCLVPQVFNAKRFDCPLDAYPRTMRVFDALMRLPPFDAAQPSKQADAA
jgi:glutathione S-transferase